MNYFDFVNWRKIFPLAVVLFIMTSCGSTAQPLVREKNEKEKALSLQGEKAYKAYTVAFYNLENLFDTIDDPNKRDDDFTPNGRDAWTSERYWHKMKNMAHVISLIGKKETGNPPVILGVAEVENRTVMEDLVHMPELKDYNYGIIHFDSPDRRGIDVGLIYRKKLFHPLAYKKYPLKIYENGHRIYTRDVLLVTGILDGEKIHVMVVHWPSRRGGEARSRPLRMKAAALDMQIIDSIQQTDPHAKIIMMGDLNDDPVSPSVKEVLRAKGKKADVPPGGLYGAMEHFYRAGIGTLAYRDSWNLFDQIFVTSPLIEGTTGKKKDFSTWKLWKSGIFNSPFLANRKGAFKGYPFRTYAGGQYLGGYSDHFPVYIILLKEFKKD